MRQWTNNSSIIDPECHRTTRRQLAVSSWPHHHPSLCPVFLALICVIFFMTTQEPCQVSASALSSSSLPSASLISSSLAASPQQAASQPALPLTSQDEELSARDDDEARNPSLPINDPLDTMMAIRRSFAINANDDAPVRLLLDQVEPDGYSVSDEEPSSFSASASSSRVSSFESPSTASASSSSSSEGSLMNQIPRKWPRLCSSYQFLFLLFLLASSFNPPLGLGSI